MLYQSIYLRISIFFIEVIEHLTPNMLKDMLLQLSKISNKGSLYIFNTGVPEYVLNEDFNYLDPTRRGHIVSYFTNAIRSITNNMNFKFAVFLVKLGHLL